MRKDETIIPCGLGAVEVRNDHGPDPERNQGQVYLEVRNDATKRAAFVGVQADELRDAIDKAVGPRGGSEPRVFIAPTGTPVPAPGTNPEDTGFEPLGWIDGASLAFEEPEPDEEPEVEKPYRPIDRDRLLRHIGDIEATLTRRNKRHEEDQERIRELEETITGLRIIIEGHEAATPSLEEQIEALEKVPAGYEAVLDPPLLLDTPEAKEWVVPPIMVDRIYRDDSSRSLRFRDAESGYGWYARPINALKLGVTAEDFGPSIETRRKEYEEQGLAEWEIELLLSHNRS